MIRRVFTAYLAEWTKYSRLVMPYVGLLTIVAMVFATLLIHPVVRDRVTDFQFIGQAVPAALNLAGFLMTLVYSAALVSSEVDSGTIRLVLTRPIRRHEFYLAKLLNALTYTALLSLTATGVAWVAALALGDLSGVAFGGELIYAPGEMYAAMAVAFMLNLAPHFAGAAYALFISVAVRRPAKAIALAIGTWLIVDYLKYPLGAAPAVFTTYLDQSWLVFQDRCNALDTPFFPAAAQDLAVSLLWFGAFTLAGIFVMARRSFGP